MTEEERVQVSARQAVLAESLEDESPPFKIHGVALAPGDITNGKNGKKFWPRETLEQAAASLQGRPLVRDHVNSVLGNVGKVTKARFEEGKGVLFQAELDDKELADKINRGRLEVSARIKHRPTAELDNHDSGASIIEPPAVFDNLSVVNSGASPSNEVELGEAAALEEDELRNALDGEAELVELHTPSYEGTATGRSWDGLNMEDFDTEDLSEIDDHFIETESSFPPETFGELSFEVVDTDGMLVREAVDSAWGLRGHSGDQSELESILLSLNDEFEDPPISTEASENEEEASPEESGEPQSAGSSDGSEEAEGESSSEQGESAQNQSEGVSDAQVDDPETARNLGVAELSRFNNKFETMKHYDIDEEALPEGAELSEPVLVDQAELSDLEDKASRADEEFDDLRDSISELSDIKERKEELEEKVAELEEKAEEIDQVKETYAAELADAAGDVVQTDDFMHLEVSELRERVEELEDEQEDAELEESDPDPDSEDVENAELEEDDDAEVDQEVSELEEKLEWYENQGWSAAAEEAREELSELKE